MLILYFAGGVFPIILSGYHNYLAFYKNGLTTNESCRGLTFRPYFKSSKNRNNLWNPRELNNNYKFALPEQEKKKISSK